MSGGDDGAVAAVRRGRGLVCWVVGGGGVGVQQSAVEGRLLGPCDEQVLLLGCCVDGLVGNGGDAGNWEAFNAR